jgi:hypothetical protein
MCSPLQDRYAPVAIGGCDTTLPSGFLIYLAIEPDELPLLYPATNVYNYTQVLARVKSGTCALASISVHPPAALLFPPTHSSIRRQASR